MKKLHVHVTVSDLEKSVGFYTTLFGGEPKVLKADYAKWMLEDPGLNFAISTSDGKTGVSHLGFQFEDEQTLADIAGRLKAGGEVTLHQKEANCCYARSNKAWAYDPDDLAWENFHTLGEADTLGCEAPQSEAINETAPGKSVAGGCC